MQLERWCAGLCEVFGGDAVGITALANFSMLETIFLDVFSTADAMLLANSEPGILGGAGDCAGEATLG